MCEDPSVELIGPPVPDVQNTEIFGEYQTEWTKWHIGCYAPSVEPPKQSGANSENTGHFTSLQMSFYRCEFRGKVTTSPLRMMQPGERSIHCTANKHIIIY